MEGLDLAGVEGSEYGSVTAMRLKITKVCVPTDFSEPADHAVHYAAALARTFSADLHLLHVLEHVGQLAMHPDFTGSGEETRDYLRRLELAATESSEATDVAADETPGHIGQYAELVRSMQSGAAQRMEAVDQHWWVGLTVFRDIRIGHPVKEINQYVESRDIDLLVIGSQGHSKIASLLLGSVTERVVQTCGCPVVVVRHPEHQFELTE